MLKIEIVGRRLYFVGDSFAHKDQLKALGAKWDADRRQWWIGSAKKTEAEKFLSDVGAGFDMNDLTDRAVRADQLEEQGRQPEADKVRQGPPKLNPADIRLTGKGEYKGRTYYLGAQTRDGKRVRCLTLPDANGDYLDFWADLDQVTITKTYQPRQVWDGRRNSGQTVTKYTTLGSIAEFVVQQRDPATRRGECTECSAWGPVGETCHECHEGTHV